MVSHDEVYAGMVRLWMSGPQFPTEGSLGPWAEYSFASRCCTNECHWAWFEKTSVLQHRTASLVYRRQGTPLFVLAMVLAFGRSHNVHEVLRKQHLYLSFLKFCYANIVGHDSSGVVCGKYPINKVAVHITR